MGDDLGEVVAGDVLEQRTAGPGERVVGEDGGLGDGGHVDLLGEGFEGGDFVGEGDVVGEAEVVAGLLVVGEEGGAGQDVVELVEEELVPCFGEFGVRFWYFSSPLAE